MNFYINPKSNWDMKKISYIVFLAAATSAFGQSGPQLANAPRDFIPAGYVVFEEIRGDLNKDNQDDYVFIIKATDKENIVTDKDRGKLDRNPRGIVIALKSKDRYQLALENRHCFSSENEDGGVYFAPELLVSIEKGNILVHYAHGRYGYWIYKFRYLNSDFELIGYDSSEDRGPVVERFTSINFLTKKMQIKENISTDPEEEKFKESWQSFSLSKRIKLRDIVLFDNLDVQSLIGQVR